jgi:enamine deaminase RidA (YjgF/YER057c/UK114 family)
MKVLPPHFSPALRAGDYIFVSGQLPFDEEMNIVEGGIEAQTRACMAHVEKALASVGSSLGHVVKAMVWLADPGDFPAFNTTYAGYFRDRPPTRATVGSTLMVPGALIEVDAIAYHPEPRHGG